VRTDILDPKESDIENRLVTRVNKRGGLAWKFVSPNNRSVPDRLVMLNGWIFFVELKAPGKWLTPKQEGKAKDIRGQWMHCWCITNFTEVEFIVDLYMLSPGPFYFLRWVI